MLHLALIPELNYSISPPEIAHGKASIDLTMEIASCTTLIRPLTAGPPTTRPLLL